MKECEFLIIGAGITGLTIARALVLRGRKNIIVVEKEEKTGIHASGKNSGVLHAGIYYTPDSLKARFCVEGNRMLSEYCRSRKLNLNRCGKVIVATDKDKLSSLYKLQEMAVKNGVNSRIINSYKFIDNYVGKIVAYLRKEDRLADTLIAIGSDHGLTPTHSHFDTPLFMDNLGYKTLYHTNIFNHLIDADASVMVSGNSMAHIYIKSKDGWNRNAFMDESENVVNELLGRNEIDIVAGIRSDSKVGIKSARGEAITWSENGNIMYKVVGNDPFGYKKKSR